MNLPHESTTFEMMKFALVFYAFEGNEDKKMASPMGFEPTVYWVIFDYHKDLAH